MSTGKIALEWAKKAQLPYWYELECESTNDVAKDQALTEKENIRLYFTDHQTSGRGRGDHSWSDVPGDLLLSSWSFRTSKSPQPTLSPLVGLAVFRALKASFPQLPLSVKAPNDLYLGEKKLAGILLENVQMGERNRLVVGLGLNVYSAPVETATSLEQALPEKIGPSELAQLLDRLLLEITMTVSNQGSTLTPSDCDALAFALNEFPMKSERILQVSPHGDLIGTTRQTKWSEL